MTVHEIAGERVGKTQQIVDFVLDEGVSFTFRKKTFKLEFLINEFIII
jgi:hypothetical protein